ncbi:hypothetical protein AVEN_84960-1 [Araneus ventricosus]|uniref:Uncharacterized protein n=1 Tax=Araneus ventricosus TaxID=182803 RepID=A0A4Y2BYH5_ARAVE|nr:hypothetical protein AVEN_84960-1 [Araneus ventricosus]
MVTTTEEVRPVIKNVAKHSHRTIIVPTRDNNRNNNTLTVACYLMVFTTKEVSPVIKNVAKHSHRIIIVPTREKRTSLLIFQLLISKAPPVG